MVSALIFALCAGALLLIRWYLNYIRYIGQLGKSLPKGPKPWPWIGTLSMIRGISSVDNKSAKTLEHLAKYGDMATIWLAKAPVVVINSPRVAHDLLTTEAAKIKYEMSGTTCDRPAPIHYRAQLLPWTLVAAPYGKQFQRLRKIYNSLLSQRGATEFRDHADQETRFMLEALVDRPGEAYQECDRFGFNVTMRAIYGVHYGADQDALVQDTVKMWKRMFRYFLPGTIILDYFPFLIKLPLWLQPWMFIFNALKRQESRLHIHHLSLIKQASGKHVTDDSSAPFAHQLLHMPESKDLDEQAVVDVLSMLLGAGAETISTFTQQFLKAMALNPEAAMEAQAELDSVVGPERLPNWGDQPRLPYTRALIREVHRWAPFADSGLPHATMEDITYAGYLIPKGTVLLPNIPSIMRSPERYTGADKFEPRRFLGSEYLSHDFDSAASAHSESWFQRDHVHFGWGRRLCPGIYVADICIFAVVSRILWGFSIKPHPARRVCMQDQEGGLVKKPLPFRLEVTSRGPGYEHVIRQAVSTCQARTEFGGFSTKGQ